MTALLDEVELERLTFRTRKGRRIVGLAARPKGVKPHSLVILVPGFARDLRSLGALSRLLNRYGYATVRYDATDHIGESDGDIRDLRFSTWVSEAQDVLRGLPHSLKHLPRFFVASSLAARPAIRALQGDDDIAGLVLIMPAVNLRATLVTAIGEDLLGEVRAGRPIVGRETVTLLSYEIGIAGVYDTVEHDLDPLEGTKAELANLRCPITAITGKVDEWISAEDVVYAMGPLNDRRKVFILESGSHNLLNLPLLRLLKETTVRALETMNGRTITEVRDLDFSETVETTKSEKRFMQQAASADENHTSRLGAVL